MKFGIQLFGVLKNRRSDTMDALRSWPDWDSNGRSHACPFPRSRDGSM